MARYGSGGEDFSAEAAELRALREQREQMIARERQVQAELAETTGLQEESARAEQTRRRAKVESREVAKRDVEAGQRSVRTTNLDTEAIERNTTARRRNAAAAQRQQINVSRAFAGARDPMFAAAYGIRGAETTQYAIRQQLQGVGQRRASAIQQALQLGIRPAGPAEAPLGPIGRAQAALEAKAAADLQLVQATKEYTNTLRRKGTTAEEAAAALAGKEAARARVTAANLELESARSADAAREANRTAVEAETRQHQKVTTAMDTEARGREKVAAAQVQQARRLDLEPVTGAGLAGGGVMRREQRQLVAAGMTTEMPLSPLAMGRRVPEVPRDIRETGMGGIVGTPQGAAREAAAAAQAAEAAAQAQARVEQQARATAAEVRAQNEALAANYLATGRASEAAHIYANDLNDMGRAGQAMEQARVDRIMDKSANSMHLMGRATRDAGINFYPLSQAMHRHGALTTEFIAAAARGETTLKEMGNQALLTAGKFAGWTLAATAVYGVAGALHSVAQGALDAQSGAEQAFRVINENPGGRDRIRGQFGDLAQEFNVPIAEASDAVYRMGQVFHDQEDAVNAARAALYSYKTGEVDVATSTKNLIAIQQGFGLSAKGLNNIFDQINEAQNKFGIGIGDTEAGLAKAAGVYKNAGGDLSTLLALFVAIQKATGRSGTEIGTGVARAVQRIREPISIEKLEAQGIEVDPQNFQKTLQNALKKAGTGQVDIQEVATGLFGNQYARLIAPVLADQRLFDKALKDTSPEAAKGSAQRELAKVLREANEQIKEVGVSLQVLGSELSRAGAFNFVMIGLKGFNELLDVIIRVVEAVNGLPQPLRVAITMFGQLAAAMAVMRKLGATERLTGGPLGFLAAPEQRERTHALAGLRRAQGEARNIAERAGMREIQAGFEVDRRRRLLEENRPQVEAARRLPVDSEDAARIRARTLQLEEGLLRSQAALEDAVVTRTAAEEVVAKTDADLAAVNKASAAQTRAVLAERAIAYPAQLDQPNVRGVVPPPVVPTGGARPGGGVGGIAAAASAAAAGLAAEAQEAATENARQVQSTRRYGRYTTRAVINARLGLGYLTGGRELGRSYRALETAGARTTTAIGRATSSIAGSIGSVRGLPGKVRGMVSSLGVFDAALIGFFAFEAIDSVIDGLSKDLDKTEKFLADYKGNTTKSQNELAQKARRAREEGTDPTFSDKLQKLNDIFNPLEIPKTIKESLEGNYNDPLKRREEAGRQMDQLAAEIRSRQRMQAKQQAAGMPRMLLTADELIKSVNEDQKDLEAGLISRREFRRRLALHQKELELLMPEVTDRQETRARGRVAAAARRGSPQDYRATLGDLKPEQLEAEAQAILAVAEYTGDYGPALRKLAQVYATQVDRWGDKEGTKGILALAQARENYYQGVQQTVQAELDANLRAAGGDEGARRAAFRRAAARYRSSLGGKTSQARRDYRADQRKLDDARRERDFLAERREESLPGVTQDPFGRDVPDTGLTPTSPDMKQLESDYEDAKKRVNRLKKRRDESKKAYTAAKRKQDELETALNEAAYEDRSTGRDIRLQLRLSQTASGSEQAALEIKFAQRQVNDAAKTFGKNSREYRQALTELNNARANAVQAILADVRAENSLLLARAGSDPAARARAEVQAATNELNALLKAQAEGKRVDPNAIKEARARVIEADTQAREQARDEADQIASLLSQIAIARAGDDPVRAARVAVREAKRARSRARTRVERLQALLDLINANNQLEDALAEQEQARIDLLASRTEDPVKIAHLETVAARKALKGSTGIDRIQKRAALNRAKTNERNAKIDSREDDINFALEMDQITREDAAKKLEALAKIKGISKQKKRELLLAAKRLRDEAEGEYDIDLGSVKLPTLYEIRRFVQGGMPVGPAGSAQVNNNQSISITVNSEGDMQRVVKVLEDNLTGTNRSIARNVGVR